MIASDVPDHTALRRIVSGPFTKRRVDEWEGMARRPSPSAGIDLQPAGPAVRTANTVLPGYSSIPVTAG